MAAERISTFYFLIPIVVMIGILYWTYRHHKTNQNNRSLDKLSKTTYIIGIFGIIGMFNFILEISLASIFGLIGYNNFAESLINSISMAILGIAIYGYMAAKAFVERENFTPGEQMAAGFLFVFSLLIVVLRWQMILGIM